MLNRITISNLATIHSLEVELERGFTVLTGETGAGKSILIEALRFVLGAKTSAEQIRTGAAQAMVEAAFDIGNHPEARKTLADLEIPADGELVLRRTIQANGRSRAVANDCGITQQKLEGLGALLVNIHGQHDNQMLLNPETHIRFVDAFGGLEAAREEVGRAHQQYSRLLRERKNLLEQAEQRERRQHELREEIAEMRAANLSEGEEKELRRENAVLTNGETLIGLTGAVCEELYEGENAILSRLAAQEALLAQAAAIDVTLQPLLEQLRPLNLAVEDIYHTLNAYSARLESEPGRLDEVNDRLAGIEKIKRRYGQTVPAVLQRLADNEHELETLEEGLERLESLDGEIAKVAGGLHDLSGKLSAGRKKAAAELDRLILEQLQELGMEKASFETRIKPLFGQDGKTPLHTADGKERLEFLLTTNPGQDLRPLFRIASGGELSRTMLAMKTILARNDPARTLIFDEVDAGIGGALAEKVAHKLRKLGKTHQVLCVTHLPQIAALGGKHLLVSKKTEHRETFTEVARLSDREQVKEVARLLSGLEVSGHTLASAEEMVSRGRAAT